MIKYSQQNEETNEFMDNRIRWVRWANPHSILFSLHLTLDVSTDTEFKLKNAIWQNRVNTNAAWLLSLITSRHRIIEEQLYLFRCWTSDVTVASEGFHHKPTLLYHTSKRDYDLLSKTVKQMILCGCWVWGYTKVDSIGEIHLKFCKFLLGLKKYFVCYLWRIWYTPITKDHRITNGKLLEQYLKFKDSELTYILYSLSIRKSEDGCYVNPLLKFVKSILDNYRLCNIWLAQSTVNA